MSKLILTQELKAKRYCKICSENYPEKIEKLIHALEEIGEIAKSNLSCEGDKHPCPQSQDILAKIDEVLR